ncbi:hypothetical protein NBRC116589_28760 [Ruegeria sp. HU-ET01832]|uniref:hypothetical protein n=1 Tax=Ruegeria sp. HU-ET01832 TaxID=3135906 RepID=UPI00147A0CB4
MPFLRPALVALIFCSLPFASAAQSQDSGPGNLQIELNALQDVEQGCRMNFLVENKTGVDIEDASFETVIFDTSGSLITLTLYPFRELPVDRPRLRRFDLRDVSCASIGQVLINGAKKCSVEGADSPICIEALKLSTRTDVELLG